MNDSAVVEEIGGSAGILEMGGGGLPAKEEDRPFPSGLPSIT